jgi:predicted enzyme related to lactoylglutathione lyase
MIVESYLAGTPSWVDLMTSDQDAAIAFYGDLFGWESDKGSPESGGYGMCAKDGEPVAGIGPLPEGAPFPAVWTTYISTSDVAATIASATEAGGHVFSPAMTISDGEQTLGRMAILGDPAGGVFGAWEPGVHTGARRVNEPGSLIWNELRSTAPAASRDFLAKVFGYTYEPQKGDADLDYQVIQVDGRQVGGVMAIPAEIKGEVQSHWLTYFAVESTDETVGNAVASGATLLAPAMDSEYGRLAILADPQGAAFAVIESVA